MKIKNVMPTIITEHAASTANEFEKLGFIQKHHLVEENKIELFIFETDGGSRIELMSPPVPGIIQGVLPTR